MFNVLSLSENAFHALSETYQGYYALAVRVGLKFVGLLELLSNDSMIVYLAIDRQGQ